MRVLVLNDPPERLLVPLRDLTYRRRQGFLQRFPLPARFPCVSFHSSTRSKASFLYLPAAYVRRRYNQASDGLVACCDAEVPGCVAGPAAHPPPWVPYTPATSSSLTWALVP